MSLTALIAFNPNDSTTEVSCMPASLAQCLKTGTSTTTFSFSRNSENLENEADTGMLWVMLRRAAVKTKDKQRGKRVRDELQQYMWCGCIGRTMAQKMTSLFTLWVIAHQTSNTQPRKHHCIWLFISFLSSSSNDLPALIVPVLIINRPLHLPLFASLGLLLEEYSFGSYAQKQKASAGSGTNTNAEKNDACMCWRK